MIVSVDNKKGNKIPILIIVIILLLVAGGIGYWFSSPDLEPEETGVVETAKTASESVPEIATNPGEQVPEINPVDRANPFRYNNPLR